MLQWRDMGTVDEIFERIVEVIGKVKTYAAPCMSDHVERQLC